MVVYVMGQGKIIDSSIMSPIWFLLQYGSP